MISNYLSMMRCSQWLKNLMIFFPPFLAGNIMFSTILPNGLLTFCAFCMVSSSGYIFNDLMDRERDIYHPQKCKRALPSGAVTVRAGAVFAFILLVLGVFLAGLSSVKIMFFVLLYAVISVMYSLVFKNIPIIDIFSVSAGFLVRLQTGGELYNIPISPWLFITVFLLAFFLSTGKRLSELKSLSKSAKLHRTSLADYPPGFLSGMLYMSGSAVLATYSIYSIDKSRLIFTVPLCMFGLLRYIFRVSSGINGDPTESLLKDWVLFAVSLVWLLMVIWSIYL